MPSVANVHVRDLPDALHLALKERAAMEGRSVNEVIVRALGRAAAQPTPAEFAARVRRAQDVPPTLTPGELSAAVRASRPAP